MQVLYLEGIKVLLCSVSSSVISSAVSSGAISSSTISMITTPGLPHYNVAMVSALIVVLALKEMLSSSQKWNMYLNNSFNIASVPLTLTFLFILLFRISTVLGK
jgi:hypothetical protein